LRSGNPGRGSVATRVPASEHEGRRLLLPPVALAVPTVGSGDVRRPTVVEEQDVVAAGTGRIAEDPERAHGARSPDGSEEAGHVVLTRPLPVANPELVEERGAGPPRGDGVDRLGAARVHQVTCPPLQHPLIGWEPRLVRGEALADVVLRDRGDAVV